MEIILLAHAIRNPINDPQKGEYDVFQGNLVDTRTTSIWAKTKEWCDIVLFSRFDTLVISTDPDKKKAPGKETVKKDQDGNAKRIVYAAKDSGHETKVRAGWTMPGSFPLDQAEFRRHLNGEGK